MSTIDADVMTDSVLPKMQIIALNHITIAFSSEKANISLLMSKLNYEYDKDLIESLLIVMPDSTTSFTELIFILYQQSLQLVSNLIDFFEKEVKTIHALSFSLSYQERYDIK